MTLTRSRRSSSGRVMSYGTGTPEFERGHGRYGSKPRLPSAVAVPGRVAPPGMELELAVGGALLRRKRWRAGAVS